VIAHELGLSTAAAHNLVQSGMKKLGIHDEMELPVLFGRALPQEADPRALILNGVREPY
jgi:DNA-binding NarL/FixJ family response regulator